MQGPFWHIGMKANSNINEFMVSRNLLSASQPCMSTSELDSTSEPTFDTYLMLLKLPLHDKQTRLALYRSGAFGPAWPLKSMGSFHCLRKPDSSAVLASENSNNFTPLKGLFSSTYWNSPFFFLGGMAGGTSLTWLSEVSSQNVNCIFILN